MVLTKRNAHKSAKVVKHHFVRTRLQEALVIARKIESGAWTLQNGDIAILRRSLEDFADVLIKKDLRANRKAR